MATQTNTYKQNAVYKATGQLAQPKMGTTDEPAKAIAVTKAAGPAMGASYEPPKTEPVMVRTNATPAMGVSNEPPPKPVSPPAKTAFDLQREDVDADRMADEARRADAVERYFSNRGLGDSGILAGAQRAERAAVAGEAGRRLSSIGQEEARQAVAISEADKAREFTSGEADKDRAITREGMAQAKELALSGLDLQKSSLALQEKGMTQQNAQFFAGLAQADKHATMGLTLEESRIDLQRQGLNQQDAQFYAGLGQAKYLAEKGFDLQGVQLELTRQGMSQQDAQFYAGLAQQKDLVTQGFEVDIQKGIIADQMMRIDPKDPNFQSKMYDLLGVFGLAESVFPGGRPAGATPTSPAATPTQPTPATNLFGQLGG